MNTKKDITYKWASPHEWFLDTHEVSADIRLLVMLLDADQIQDEFQNDMDDDGYFEPLPENFVIIKRDGE